MTETGTAYRVSQINADTSNCSYEYERRFTAVVGDAALDAKKRAWREEIQANRAWSSDFIRVRKI